MDLREKLESNAIVWGWAEDVPEQVLRLFANELLTEAGQLRDEAAGAPATALLANFAAERLENVARRLTGRHEHGASLEYQGEVTTDVRPTPGLEATADAAKDAEPAGFFG